MRWEADLDSTGNSNHTLLQRNIFFNSVVLSKQGILTQLRCGCLPLKVELGRYRSPKPPASERTCHLCQSESGDEPHFLLKCPVLNDHGQALLTAMADKNESFESLSNEDKTVLILPWSCVARNRQ